MKNKVFLFHGPTFSGKTRLGLTFPTPLSLLDCEKSADFLLEKHKKSDLISKFEVSCWADMTHALDTISVSPFKEQFEEKNGVQASVMIDSGTPFSTWSFMAASSELQRDTDLWYHAGSMIENLFTRLRALPVYTIITAREKERHENGHPTGELIPDINKKAEYFADSVIRCLGPTKKTLDDGSTVKVYKYLVEKDRQFDIEGETYENLHYAKLMNLDQVPTI